MSPSFVVVPAAGQGKVGIGVNRRDVDAAAEAKGRRRSRIKVGASERGAKRRGVTSAKCRRSTSLVVSSGKWLARQPEGQALTEGRCLQREWQGKGGSFLLTASKKNDAPLGEVRRRQSTCVESRVDQCRKSLTAPVAEAGHQRRSRQ